MGGLASNRSDAVVEEVMAEDSSPQSIDFHYIKSNNFHVVHADGVWGGPTPRGYVSMSFYSERNPIPRRITFELTPEGDLGKLGKEVGRDTREGIVREVGVEVLLDLDLAINLAKWLAEKIKALQEQNNAIAKKEKGN